MSKKCCVVNCRSAQNEVAFFKFPNTETRLLKWLVYIGCDSLSNLSYKEIQKRQVCAKHFENKFLAPNEGNNRKRKRLRQCAYPTLFTEREINNGVPKTHIEFPGTISKSLHQDHSYHIDLELEEVNYNSVLKKFNIGNGQFVATKPEVRSHDPLDHKIDIKINKENDIHDIQEITEVIKIETPDDEDLPDDVGLPDDEVLPYDGAFLDDMVLPDDVVLSDKYDLPASQPEDLNTLLGSDDFAASGFGPLVRPGSSYMLPIINMFAVMEFIAANDHYCKLNYQKLKELARKEQHKLLSNLRVQSCVSVHRIRGTIHLETSALCAIEYDVRTHTVTRSECMACPLATCPHVAALLMWLYAASNRPTYDPKFVIDDDDISTGTSKHVHAGGNTKVTIELPPKPAVSARAGVPGLRDPAAGAPGLRDPAAGAPGPGDPATGAPGSGDPAAGAPGPGDPATGAPGSGDPADEDEAQLVDEETPGPSTAKRKKMPLPKVTPRYTATISKTKSVPKETDDNTGDSIIKCSFTRKCFFDVWRSTTGSSTERVAHTRTIMTEAFRDPEYVIDFQPLERRLELLCTELEGYWNADTNKPSFESKHMEWLTDTEYIEMKKQKRVINNKVFKKRVFTKKI